MMETSFQELDVANDPLDMMNPESMEIEVGRDAPQSDAIQPFQRDSFLASDKIDQAPQFDIGEGLNFEPEGNPNFSSHLEESPTNDKRKSLGNDSVANEMNLSFDVDVSR